MTAPTSTAMAAPTPPWVGTLRSFIRDLVQAGTDATQPIAERRIGRHAARRRIQAAEKNIDALLSVVCGGSEPAWVTEARADDLRIVQSQLDEIHETWGELLAARDESEVRETVADVPLSGLLLLGLAQDYAEAGRDPPVVAVLISLRDTVESWERMRRGSTPFASVPGTDLVMLARRLDIAIEIVRRTPVLGGPS